MCDTGIGNFVEPFSPLLVPQVSWAFGGYSEEEKSKFFEALKYDPDYILSDLVKELFDLSYKDKEWFV